MFFKKKTTEPRRSRQPLPSGGLGAKPVFSYHAQSGRSQPTPAGAPRATRLLWTNSPPKPSSPRQIPRSGPKRAFVILMAILAAALGIYSLFLGRDPRVVIAARSDGRQVLLRDQNVYLEAGRAILASSLANSNKLTIDTAKVAARLQQQFPELERVAVALPLIGRQPTLYLQPAQPSLLLKDGSGELFLVNSEGRAMMNASGVPARAKLGLPVVDDQSGLPITLGKGALTRDNIAFITEVLGQLSAKKLQVTALVLPAGASEFQLQLKGTPYIVKFNLRGDARAEVGAFLAVKQHLESQKKTPASYIDVRVDNRAYYR